MRDAQARLWTALCFCRCGGQHANNPDVAGVAGSAGAARSPDNEHATTATWSGRRFAAPPARRSPASGASSWLACCNHYCATASSSAEVSTTGLEAGDGCDGHCTPSRLPCPTPGQPASRSSRVATASSRQSGTAPSDKQEAEATAWANCTSVVHLLAADWHHCHARSTSEQRRRQAGIGERAATAASQQRDPACVCLSRHAGCVALSATVFRASQMATPAWHTLRGPAAIGGWLWCARSMPGACRRTRELRDAR